jgi:two-component system osmolarity sensor histidine kinase EnvZ
MFLFPMGPSKVNDSNPRAGKIAAMFNRLKKLWPRSLLWRTFLLVALLMLLSVAAWFAIFHSYEREPRAQQLAQTLVSVANLTRAALISARVDARPELIRDLSDHEGIHLYPAEVDDQIKPLPDNAFLQRVETLVKSSLGPNTRLAREREGEEALFISFRIDDTADGEYWLALPSDRLARVLPLSWIGWSAAALLLSLLGAWLIVFRITRPLKLLEHAAKKVGAGQTPPHLPEHGPTEVATVSHAFNQMSADLIQLDQDRALILAGISHDLRTPLTRLRMGIEMTTDGAMREGMVADVEEMDKTIGQFLDFARVDSGETLSEINLGALLTELATQYQRRGFTVIAIPPTLNSEKFKTFTLGQPQALRRAVGNLIDNALRYAGQEQPIELTLTRAERMLIIDVSDRGPGIPEDAVERMKRPFTRLDSARSNATGAGLGLAIVDRIIRTHNGRLDLLPRSPNGLIARITLPGS